MPWGQTGGHADTTEAIERTLALAVRYAFQPHELATTISDNTRLTQIDDTVVSMTVAYGAVLGLLVQGHALNNSLSGKLMRMVKTGKLPFHAVTYADLQPPRPGDPDPPRAGRFASPDALLTPSSVAEAATDPDIRIEPAWKVSIVYGMPCAIYHQLPAAYYLAARFHDDFESAVLNAINGGGQNQSRADTHRRAGRGSGRPLRHSAEISGWAGGRRNAPAARLGSCIQGRRSLLVRGNPDCEAQFPEMSLLPLARKSGLMDLPGPGEQEFCIKAMENRSRQPEPQL